MTVERVIDIDSLVQPISDDQPAGGDIRDDVSPASVYYRLKDARSGARAAERSGEADDGGLLAEWRLVLDLAPEVLAGQAKDLEVAAWYVEALARAHGFAGLRDGFELTRRLVEDFWDGLYPLPDEDGIETRVAPFSGLNGEGGDGTLIQPIRKIPLSEGDPVFAAWQYEQALELAQIADEEARQRRIDAGALTMQMIESSLAQCSPGFFGALLDEIDGAIEAFRALSAAFDAKAGHDAPPAGNIRNRLSSIRGIAATVSSGRLPEAPEPEPEAAPDPGAAAAPGAAARPAAAANPEAIASREQAFRILGKVAEYFRKHEPQAPTAYAIEELVRRGQMSFSELLEELMEDAEARKRLLIATGLRNPDTYQG